MTLRLDSYYRPDLRRTPYVCRVEHPDLFDNPAYVAKVEAMEVWVRVKRPCQFYFYRSYDEGLFEFRFNTQAGAHAFASVWKENRSDEKI